MSAWSLCAVACAAALTATPPPAAAAGKDKTYGTRLGSHSMLYLNHTAVQQEALIRAAAEARLRYLRMDFAVGLVFELGHTDFSAVERVNALAVRYGVRIVATITETPWYIAECPAGRSDHPGRCPPAREHEDSWREMVAQVVRHAPRIRHWELGNEPDNGFGFAGTTADYARWATLTFQGVKAAQPGARIVISGFSRLDTTFIAAVLHDAGNPLIGRIDIANVHLRGRLRRMDAAVRRARAFYRRAGFSGPLWITETGYPSAASSQTDPPLTRGEADQAKWIACGARTMIHAGAAAVFVAFRDNAEFGPGSGFASEGVVRWPRLNAAGRPHPKPAFRALKALAAANVPAGGGTDATRGGSPCRGAHRARLA